MAPQEPPTLDNAQPTSRSTTSTHGRAPASKCSMLTARWRPSAGAALVGFGGRADVDVHQMARPLGRSLRASRRIATR